MINTRFILETPFEAAGIDEALAELGTDYLDLYLMHGIDDVRMLDREYLALGEKLKAQGKIVYRPFKSKDGKRLKTLDGRIYEIGPGGQLRSTKQKPILTKKERAKLKRAQRKIDAAKTNEESR